MKQYIKKNLTPLLIGATIGMAYSIAFNCISDLVLKVALILNGY
jgi:hypothetical protein